MSEQDRAILSLRILVPGLLLIVLLTAVASIYRATLADAERDVMENAVVSLGQHLERVRNALAFYASIAATEQIQQELAALCADPAVEAAFFLNEHDQVVAASRRASIGRTAAAVFAEMAQFAGTGYAQLMERPRATGVSQVVHSGAGYVIGAAVIALRQQSEGLRPTERLGGLILVETTAPMLRVARGQAQQQAAVLAGIVAVMAIAIGAALHLLVTRPVTQLLGAVSRFAAGDEHARAPLAGAGELVLLARGVNEAIKKVLRAQKDVQRLNIELEQRVQDRTAQLEATNRELESFSYSVSHDLRAPLRSIDGFSQVLMEECQDKLDEQGLDALQRVRAAACRMGALIDDLLNLSRVTRAELNLEPVDIGRLAQEVLAGLQTSDPQREVDVQIAPRLIAQADARLLRIVLENLLGNAWKFTRHTPAARIEVGAELRDGQPVFYVRDNGAGFDMAYAAKLFTPFQRLHKPEEFEGTGVGLATVARIVHRHGGQVWATGKVGEGATFWFSLGRISASG